MIPANIRQWMCCDEVFLASTEGCWRGRHRQPGTGRFTGREAGRGGAGQGGAGSVNGVGRDCGEGMGGMRLWEGTAAQHIRILYLFSIMCSASKRVNTRAAPPLALCVLSSVIKRDTRCCIIFYEQSICKASNFSNLHINDLISKRDIL